MRGRRQGYSDGWASQGKRNNEMFHSAASEQVDGGVVNSEGNVLINAWSLGTDTDIMELPRWACLFHANGV